MGRLIIPDLALWAQTVAIAGSACAAFWMIVENRSQSKKRATVEALLKLRLDSDYIKHRDDFRKLTADEDNLAKYASSEHLHSTNTMLIFRILNYQEYLATGIAEGAFDEDIYKRMTYSSCMSDWDRLAGFVTELRQVTGSATLYQEFETMVDGWKTKTLTKK